MMMNELLLAQGQYSYPSNYYFERMDIRPNEETHVVLLESLTMPSDVLDHVLLDSQSAGWYQYVLIMRHGVGSLQP